MKFTAQEEYGLRCILQLARIEPDATGSAGADGASTPYLRVGEIAETEGISEQYVGKLFRILAKGGLVESVRGRNGGYRLSRPADQIHVAETLAVLGGRIYDPGTCERYTGNMRFCVHTNDCSIRSLWAGLQLMIERVLSGTTLRDLVCTEKTMNQWMQSYAGVEDTYREGAERERAPGFVAISSVSGSSRRSVPEGEEAAGAEENG